MIYYSLQCRKSVVRCIYTPYLMSKQIFIKRRTYYHNNTLVRSSTVRLAIFDNSQIWFEKSSLVLSSKSLHCRTSSRLFLSSSCKQDIAALADFNCSVEQTTKCLAPFLFVEGRAASASSILSNCPKIKGILLHSLIKQYLLIFNSQIIL